MALSGGSSGARHIKCPNVKANPLLSPRLLLYWLRKHLAGISLALLFHDFTTLVVWSGDCGEKWQFWVENGKEIVEQMIFATFRQLRAAAADKGQSG